MDGIAKLIARPFLLMEGGPLFNIQKRVGLIKHNAPFLKRRALLAALLTWLPLLVLSAIQGRAFGHSVPIPFVRDFSTYTRFLLAVPLLLLAENILGPRIAQAAAHFVTSGVVVEKDFERFDKIVGRWSARARFHSCGSRDCGPRLRFFVPRIPGNRGAMSVPGTATRTDGGVSFTWAGLWLQWFCVPLYQFLILRWLWRLFLWFQFLARARKLEMQLFPTHPDGAGGLGFVGEAQRFFGILLFAFSIGSAGVIAKEVVYDSISLQTFAPSIAAYVVVALIIVLGPLIIFTGTLLETKRIGLQQYGTLATTYTGSFHRKWIKRENPDHDPLLGSGDIQSLADLGNSYNYIEKMKPIPLEFRTVIHLIVASLLPLTPLLLTVMSLKDVLKLLLKVVM